MAQNFAIILDSRLQPILPFYSSFWLRCQSKSVNLDSFAHLFPSMLPASFLILAVVIFRCAVGASDSEMLRALGNFSPLAAVALCSGAIFPRKWAVVVPVAAQVISDAALHILRPHPFSTSYSLVLLFSYLVLIGIGLAVRKGLTFGKLMGASIFGTIVFYVVTNTASFFYDPGYAKTFAGWIQALTTGIPGFPPTYVFLWKSLAGNLLFTSLIGLAVGLWQPAAESETESETEPAEA